MNNLSYRKPMITPRGIRATMTLGKQLLKASCYSASKHSWTRSYMELLTEIGVWVDQSLEQHHNSWVAKEQAWLKIVSGGML